MTIQANEIKVLEQLLLVDLSGIHLWTARKKLQPEMFEGKIPPEDLASLGSMRVIDPIRVKPFEKIKRKATTVLETYGVKFLGGYAVSQGSIQNVVDELEKLKSEFYSLKTNFLQNYDRWIADWVNKGWSKEEWRQAIQSSVTPKAKVDDGLQFGYAACRVAPDGDKHLSDTLGKQVRGLSDQLYAETADTAARLMESGLAVRGHVTQTTLNTVRKINAKLRGLMFLSSDVKALTDHIEQVLATIPRTGPVSGTEYNTVVTLVSALSDEDSIKRLVKNLNTANGHESAPQAKPEVAPAPVQASLDPEPAPQAQLAVQMEPGEEIDFGFDSLLHEPADAETTDVSEETAPIGQVPPAAVEQALQNFWF